MVACAVTSKLDLNACDLYSKVCGETNPFLKCGRDGYGSCMCMCVWLCHSSALPQDNLHL